MAEEWDEEDITVEEEDDWEDDQCFECGEIGDDCTCDEETA